jgi:hypothetical protein
LITTATAVPASAFYWYDWPAGPPRQKTLIRPKKDQERNPPDRPPVGPAPIDIPPTGPGPNPVPEPATLLGVLTGMGSLALGRALRKSRGGSNPVAP